MCARVCACVVLLVWFFLGLVMAAIRLRQWLLAAAVAYNYAKVCKYGDLAVPIHYFPHSHRKKLQFIFACLAGWLTVCCGSLPRSLSHSLCVCMYVSRTNVCAILKTIGTRSKPQHIYLRRKAYRYIQSTALCVWNAYRLKPKWYAHAHTEREYWYELSSVSVYHSVY